MASISVRGYRGEDEQPPPGQTAGPASWTALDKTVKQSAAESPLRVFGAMLAYYRTRAGLTPEQLGARVFVSGSQIRKVEAGTRTPTEDLVKACEAIGELGCNGALTELYDILGEKLKRRAYPGWFAAWPDKEGQARRLRSFELVVVPGLLQTEAYARAVLSTRVGATLDEIDETVAARLARQQILDRDQPPELWAILDEGILRRPVGEPAVMRGQLTHLAGMARQPHVVVQVIPIAAGAHQGLNGGAFVIADFDDAATIAYQDTAVSGQIIEDASEAGALAHTWDTLRLEALPRAASLTLIEETASQWT
jgi:transcriptional regulator with XRE-family HTH domain